jgi:phosphate transporter
VAGNSAAYDTSLVQLVHSIATMKFSHTLSLNANPDWAKHYVDYAGLKKIINEAQAHKAGDTESDPEAVQESRRELFLNKVTPMVSLVRQFYDQKKAELDIEMARLRPQLAKSESRMSLANLSERTPLVSSNSLAAMGINLEDQRRAICDLYTQYHSLRQYAELNCEAVRKILKKYDKTLLDNLKETHLESLKLLLPFWGNNTPELDASLNTLQKYFAHFYCNDDDKEASRQLKLMIREVISFQRHSVWLDVIQDQRVKENATVAEAKKPTPDAEKKKPLITTHRVVAAISVLTFLAILYWPTPIFGVNEDPTQRNALALFVFVSILWAAETLPLFVTSMLVPFLAVVLRVISIDGVRLDATEASRHVFGHMFSHVILLLLGGFSIAAALSKHNIAQILAMQISRHCGTGLRTVLLVNMMIATGASMWISNVAAPVLCYSLLTPILKASSAETSRAVFGTKQRISADQDERLCRALVMGVALASNVGGMASPISSPQNLFAIEYTPIGWLAWFIVSIPLCIILNFAIWMWLCFCYDLPSVHSAAVQYALQRDRSTDPFTQSQYFVVAVSVGTVLLWCASVDLANVTGQMGILGIVPFALFFGSGILTTNDLNSFLWSVVILAMGGLVLGEVVKTSGLLDVIAENIAAFIEDGQLSLWATMSIFCALILFCTTFVSHTVGAIVVIPIVQAVGSQMSGASHDKELVFAAALACSAAMGLPVSGFPNMTAVNVEDNLGNRYLATSDFLKYAVPASLISLALILTLGKWLIRLAVEIDGYGM